MTLYATMKAAKQSGMVPAAVLVGNKVLYAHKPNLDDWMRAAGKLHTRVPTGRGKTAVDYMVGDFDGHYAWWTRCDGVPGTPRLFTGKFERDYALTEAMGDGVAN